ncbi:MAG: hypothetical protein WCH34_07940 [Bacteroidota bacterium]
MSKPRKQDILVLSDHSNPEVNKNKILLVGGKMEESLNPAISALGTSLVTSGTTLNTKITNKANADAAAESATTELHDANEAGCKLYKSTIAEIKKILPDNPTAWKEFYYDLSSDIAHDMDVPEKVEGGSGTQSDFAGQCDAHWKPTLRAKFYTVRISNDDPLDLSKYIRVEDPKDSFTSSSIRFVVPEDMRNKVLWIKVTASNSTGKGPASDPFGGIIIQ